jgi:DHA2 family multidrug resistance protein
MGLAMMPSFTAWMASAPPSQTQAASALQNVMRQIYGAAGTAMLASVLQSRIAFHYSGLTTFITPDAPAVARALQIGQQYALEHGLALAQVKAQVIGGLAGQARMAAAVRGFDDCFLVATLVCLLGIGPALLLQRTATHGPPRGAPAE